MNIMQMNMMNEYHANEYDGMNKGNELLRVRMQMNDGNVLLRMQSYE